jgi:serine protease Do
VAKPEAKPVLGGKLTPRYLATLVAAAFAILVIGSALRPRKSASEAAPPPSQTEVRRLQRRAERQSLETMSDHFAGVATDVASRLVQVGQGSGIVWRADLVVAAGQAEAEGESTTISTASGEPLVASRVVGGPDLPLAAFQVAGQLEPSERRENGAADLSPGAWVIAVWRDAAGHTFAPGHYVETLPAPCGDFAAREVVSSLELTPRMAGAGLFDLDGVLVGVVVPCAGRYAALSPESVALGLARGRSFEGRLCARYGLQVASLDDDARAHLGAKSGVLVTEVWADHAGDLAGLRPGDVIASAGGNPVASPQDLQPLLARTDREGVVLGVWRARQRKEVSLAAGAPGAAPSRQSDDGSGLQLAAAAEGYRIGRIAPGSPAAEAGVREGDRLLRLDLAVPRTRAEASRALARKGEPVFVEIQRGPRRFGVLLRQR